MASFAAYRHGQLTVVERKINPQVYQGILEDSISVADSKLKFDNQLLSQATCLLQELLSVCIYCQIQRDS